MHLEGHDAGVSARTCLSNLWPPCAFPSPLLAQVQVRAQKRPTSPLTPPHTCRAKLSAHLIQNAAPGQCLELSCFQGLIVHMPRPVTWSIKQILWLQPDPPWHSQGP